MTDDVIQLVERLKSGDERAWQELVRRYERLIYSVAARTGLDDTDRDEVFQSTCLVAVRSIDRLRDPKRLSSWLYGIAHRLSADMHRSRRRRGVQVDASEDHIAGTLGTADAAVDEELSRLESVSHLMDALDAIDARCATLLRALYLQDPRPSYEEIGRRLEMPVGSIGPTRARCLKKVRERLEETADVRRPLD